MFIKATGQSTIKLNSNGTIELIGVNIKITGSTSVAINGGKIDSIANGVHKMHGSEVDIN